MENPNTEEYLAEYLQKKSERKQAAPGSSAYPDLDRYISIYYIEELPRPCAAPTQSMGAAMMASPAAPKEAARPVAKSEPVHSNGTLTKPKRSFADFLAKSRKAEGTAAKGSALPPIQSYEVSCDDEAVGIGFDEEHESALEERMKHLSDTFSQYLLYLIEAKGMTNAEVYKRAIVDKKVFSKLKSNPDYHTNKITAMCLCVGAKLNLDETRDLLARAGYALSPCDKTDIIFRYFIENEIYDMIELDIQLEEHGLPCLIR